MTWVQPLLEAERAGYLSAIEVWETLLGCADVDDPGRVARFVLRTLGWPVDDEMVEDEEIVIVD